LPRSRLCFRGSIPTQTPLTLTSLPCASRALFSCCGACFSARPEQDSLDEPRTEYLDPGPPVAARVCARTVWRSASLEVPRFVPSTFPGRAVLPESDQLPGHSASTFSDPGTHAEDLFVLAVFNASRLGCFADSVALRRRPPGHSWPVSLRRTFRAHGSGCYRDLAKTFRFRRHPWDSLDSSQFCFRPRVNTSFNASRPHAVSPCAAARV
jgi:hypothetical protein